ncbi:hypothetical protein [Streptomyces sp. NRRL F-5727]|uniref:hypothetical protein n=1 Tax=Streptomyces sp. NRRL F-5727 TaxID=1463871 RepID=UPI0018FE218E|nr:hypothetical protein [Streptomyces sp. NRRL F-5727]
MPYVTARRDCGAFEPGASWCDLDLGPRTGFGDEWLRIGPTKVLSDGTLIGRSAAMCRDHHDTPGSSGLLAFECERPRPAGVVSTIRSSARMSATPRQGRGPRPTCAPGRRGRTATSDGPAGAGQAGRRMPTTGLRGDAATSPGRTPETKSLQAPLIAVGSGMILVPSA